LSTLNRTPCVGICSTTYGDLVCRGCKRFAHEIVQWNGFDDWQRGLVWRRLQTLRDGAVARHLRITDNVRLRAAADELRVPQAVQLSAEGLAFEVLRRAARRRPKLAALGLESLEITTPEQLLEAIETDFYQRSLARYERDFRTLAK